MSRVLWIACSLWLALALATAGVRGARAFRGGQWPRIAARLKRPTVYLFAGYLLIAAFVTPISPGESSSPLLWLALILPATYALATLSAAGAPRGIGSAGASALLYGGAVLAASALALALASPRYVPLWMR